MELYKTRLSEISLTLKTYEHIEELDLQLLNSSITSTISVIQNELLFTPFKYALELYTKHYIQNNNIEIIENNHALILFIKKNIINQSDKKNKDNTNGLHVSKPSTINVNDNLTILPEKKEKSGQNDLIIICGISAMVVILILFF
ncbi:hypothetical protein COBT_001548, partial [Conglomerata obtusa]